MFKNLKDKVATQVAKTNQTFFSAILPSDSENDRSRLDSASSDISQTTSYISPPRQHTLPSDIESEYGGDENNHEINHAIQQKLKIYKNKFSQLQKAYTEVEQENTRIKDMLQKSQDENIQRQAKFREQIKQIKDQAKEEIKLRDNQLEIFLRMQKESLPSDQEEIRTLREQNTKLEISIARYQETIRTQQEKQDEIIKERDDFRVQLNEKSLIQDYQSEDSLAEIKEQLESTRLYVEQLQTELESRNQLDEDIKHERDEFKKKYEQLNQEIISLNQRLTSFDSLKTEYENLTNELHQTKEAKESLQSLYDQTNKLESIQQDEESTQKLIDELKSDLSKLQHRYDESKTNSNQLTQTLDIQREEHAKEIELNKKLQEENNRIKLQLENELEVADKKVQDLSSEINRLKQLSDEQNKELEILKSQTEQTDESNSLKEEFDVKTKQLQNEITQLNATIKEHEQFRQTIETSQINDRKLLEEKDTMIDTLKQDYQKLNEEHEKQQETFDNLRQQLTSEINEKYSQLETKLNGTLSEKSELENELDSVRQQMQTTESTLNEKTNEQKFKLEQTIKELETECSSYRNEIEELKSEMASLVTLNEENTRRIDEFDNEKFDFEQEINEKDRQIQERDEKIQEIELTLKQTKEKGDKLRQALQKKNESISNNNNDQIDSRDTENRLRKLTEDYEQRLKEQEINYNTKLKSMAKEMSVQIDERELNYNRQLQDFIQNNHKTEKDLINKSEQRVIDAEQRAFIAEKQISKLEEEIKEKQLDYYRVLQDLQNQVEKLTRAKPQTTEEFSQTAVEDLTHLNEGPVALVFEPTEVDYLKQIVLAYMTGTDRLTMAKVICAVLRYTDNEKTLIIEHERLRQSRWLNPTA